MMGCPNCGGSLRKRVVDTTEGYDRNESDARDYFWECVKCGVGFEQHKIDRLME